MMKQTPTIAMQTQTLAHVMPEKEPCCQPWRFAISESSANVMTNSVRAVQIFPTMIPATRSDAMLCTRLDTASMNRVAIIEPTKAAAMSVNDEMCSIVCIMKMSTNATTIFAPDEIPSTKGPAIGFLKNVWSRKPDSARAPPSTADVMIRGSLIDQTISIVFSVP